MIIRFFPGYFFDQLYFWQDKMYRNQDEFCKKNILPKSPLILYFFVC